MAFKFEQNVAPGTIVEVSPGRRMIFQDNRWKLYFNNNATAAGYILDEELDALNAEQDAADAALQQEIDETEAALITLIAERFAKTGGTVTGDAVFEKRIGVPVVLPAALDLDLSSGTYFKKTISSASTFTFSNPPPGNQAHAFTLALYLTGGSVAFPASVKFSGDTAPTLTTNKYHLFTFITDNGGVSWRGAVNSNYSA